MKIFPNFCNSCPLLKQADVRPCPAGYKNPAKTLEGAIRQAAHKGEWPCSYSPNRGKFLEAQGHTRPRILHFGHNFNQI